MQPELYVWTRRRYFVACAVASCCVGAARWGRVCEHEPHTLCCIETSAHSPFAPGVPLLPGLPFVPPAVGALVGVPGVVPAAVGALVGVWLGVPLAVGVALLPGVVGVVAGVGLPPGDPPGVPLEPGCPLEPGWPFVPGLAGAPPGPPASILRHVLTRTRHAVCGQHRN